MRDRLHGYSSAQLDRLIFSMFWELPSEAYVGRALGVGESAVEQSLERTCTRISALTQAHWQAKLLRQIDELVQLTDRLSEAEDPPRISIAARVRLAAMRQTFLAASEPAAPAPAPAGSAPAPAAPEQAAAQRATQHRIRRLDFTPAQCAGDLAHAE
jgi:hypothetical protein